MNKISRTQIISLILCFALVIPSLCFAATSTTASAAEYVFEERLLYGGTAIDVGNMIYYAAEDGLRLRAYGSDESRLLLTLDVSYLNYSRGKLWFIADNKVCSCLTDGSYLEVYRSYDEEISHLYVSDEFIYILRDESVFSLSEDSDECVFTRDGMKGFIPEYGTFRWVSDNPGYTDLPDELGDEIYIEYPDEYLTHYVNLNGEDVPASEVQGASGGDESAVTSTAINYTGPYVNVGNVTLPLANHMPGTFFSKNGQACLCHHTSATYCIENEGNCNCMRYYPTGNKATCDVDLLGAQCFAFARMVFYSCFGFIDHSMNSSLYYNVGTLQSGAVTANTLRELFMKAAPGAHVRMAAGHSVSILTMDDDFLVIYHGNAGGDGVVAAPCVVSTRRYTWEQFANSAAKGILYINMPYNYPGTSVRLTEKITGYYRLNANLNLRSAANTQSASLSVIPNGTIITVSEVNGYWGKTAYGGNTGWVFLEYATYYSGLSIQPSSGGTYTRDADGKYIRGSALKQTLDLFEQNFDKQNITVTSAEGTLLSDDDYVGTGCSVSIEVGGETVDSAVIVISGDVNGNGFIDVGDYVLIKRAVIGTVSLKNERYAAADISGDGSVGPDDYVMVRRYFLGTL